jgi:hypothetical protein
VFASQDNVRRVTDQQNLDRKEVQRVLAGKAHSHFRHPWATQSPGEWEYRAIAAIGEVGAEYDALSGSMSQSMTLSEVDGRSVSDISGLSREAASPSPDKGKSIDRRASASTMASVSAHSSVSMRDKSAGPVGTPRRAAPPSSIATTAKLSSRTASTATAADNTKKPMSKSALVKPPTSPPLRAGPGGHHLPLRLSDASPAPDPHAHPCTPPAPASALSMYMLSHRYAIPALEGLAKERILKGLTVESCMPML